MAVRRGIPTGLSTLSIRGSSYFAAPILELFGESLSLEAVVQVEIKESSVYYIKGMLSPQLTLWVEDNHGNIVSEKVEKSSKK